MYNHEVGNKLTIKDAYNNNHCEISIYDGKLLLKDGFSKVSTIVTHESNDYMNQIHSTFATDDLFSIMRKRIEKLETQILMLRKDMFSMMEKVSNLEIKSVDKLDTLFSDEDDGFKFSECDNFDGMNSSKKESPDFMNPETFKMLDLG